MSSLRQSFRKCKWFNSLATAAVALLALAPVLAAGAGPSGGANGGGKSAAALDTVTFGVLRAPTGALAVVANEKGWFEKAGVKVKTISFAEGGGPAIIQAMGGGEPDIALLNLATAVLALSKSSFDVQIIGVPDNPVMALPLLAKPEISSVKDLKGKRVSTPPNGGQYYLLSQILSANGMDFKDIDYRPMPIGNAQAAFVAGSLDAVISSANGTVLIPKAAPGTKVLATGKDLGGAKGEPVVNPDVLVATRSIIEKHPEAVRAFVKAYQGTAVSALQDKSTRKATIEEIQKYMKSVGAGSHELEAAIKSTDALEFYTYDEAKKILNSEKFQKAIQAQGDYWFNAGVLKSKPDLSKAVNTSLMD